MMMKVMLTMERAAMFPVPDAGVRTMSMHSKKT
jgi:hypothetical protein